VIAASITGQAMTQFAFRFVDLTLVALIFTAFT